MTNGSMPENQETIADVMDPLQLSKIEAVHRGFLYQHLYAVACLFKLAAQEEGAVIIEWDEDVEYSTRNETTCIQVKTRNHPLRNSDIEGTLTRFEKLRSHFARISPEKKHIFVIVSNEDPGPKLTKQHDGKDWPPDVSIMSPSQMPPSLSSLPPAWGSLDSAVKWCIEAAVNIPFATLPPETLVWKLAARVQFAATGEDRDREDHIFDRSELPSLFEQLVEQLQEFPAVPDDYRPQQDEPPLASDVRVRLVVGFSGAGKTVWASWQARHSSAPAVYFDVGDLPGNALARSLARELAARFLGRGVTGAGNLPAASGLELLSALNKRIALPEAPIVVLDNVQRIGVEDLRGILDTCPRVRFILLAQPWSGKTQLEALLNIESEELHGWDQDTIAAVFSSAGAVIGPQAAARWRSITAGLPLFVKNAALLSMKLADGDAAAFAGQVAQGEHPEELAQDAILRLMIETMSEDESVMTAAFSLSTVPLSSAEVHTYLGALEAPMHQYAAVMRSLQRKGVLQASANGYQKIHDAVRVAASDCVSRLSVDSKRALQIELRNILYRSLLESQDLTRLGAWMRLLAPTGEIETLVDLATSESFHEYGEQQDLREILVSVADAEDTEPSLRFWALDALAFWQFQESGPRHLTDDYHARMADLITTSELGNREEAALIIKEMLNSALNQDQEATDVALDRASVFCGEDPQLSRILRYNYATALFHCGAINEARDIAESLYSEYYDVLDLHPADIVGANNQAIIDLLPRDHGECKDDLKRLADCLNLAAMCIRRSGEHPRLTAIHAAKFYIISGSYKSAMKVAQDIADDFIACGDAEGARLTMEDHVLPLLRHMQFDASVLDVRAQYAVVLAYCGEFNHARAEMDKLAPYVAEAPLEHQEGVANQRRMIEDIAAGQLHDAKATFHNLISDEAQPFSTRPPGGCRSSPRPAANGAAWS